jgi:peptide deformylase
MSEDFIIDTETGIKSADIEQSIEPLPLFNELHPMLAQTIPKFDVSGLPNSAINILIKRLKMTMKLYSGIGLSANQCGVLQRMFIIGSGDDSWACINPEILETSADLVYEAEGCLSFPGLSVSIDRPKWVEVEYYNENGGQVQMRFDGLTARCFQHELDHMNGVRMIDKVKPLALQMAREKQKKLIKKIMRFKKQYD